MKNYEKKIAEAIRLEYEEKTGRLFIVFEVTDEQYKRDIKKNWVEDIEYRIIDKNLVLNEE
jgi:predicted house-cleaning noncanonical NTP pyrophosphatase (MazG superfamily)